jgi:hypothetical protein
MMKQYLTSIDSGNFDAKKNRYHTLWFIEG